MANFESPFHEDPSEDEAEAPTFSSNTESVDHATRNINSAGESAAGNQSDPYFLSEHNRAPKDTTAVPPLQGKPVKGTSEYDFERLQGHGAILETGLHDEDRDDSGDYNPSKERTTPRKRRLGNISKIKETAKEHNNSPGTESQLCEPIEIQFRSKRHRQDAEERTNPVLDNLNATKELPSLDDVVKRGCKRCLASGLLCYLTHGGSYPCQDCRVSQTECDLIVEPKLKQQCNNCRRNRRKCSFQVTNDHRGHCQQCKSKGLHCVAGPDLEAQELGIFGNQPKAAQSSWSLDLDYKACSQCRREGVNCSLKRNYGYHDCDRCKYLGQTCSFEDIETREADKRASVVEKEHKSNGRSSKVEPRSTLKVSDTIVVNDPHRGHIGDTIIIEDPSADLGGDEDEESDEADESDDADEADQVVHRAQREYQTMALGHYDNLVKPASVDTADAPFSLVTRLAHPITILDGPQSNKGPTCHWCTDIRYGLIGMPARTVLVVNQPNSKGLREIREESAKSE